MELNDGWFTSLISSIRGALGSIRNRKTVEENIPKSQNSKKQKKKRQNKKNQKNIYRHRKPHAKPTNFHILVVKTLINPIQRWQLKQNGFHGYERPVEAKNCRSNRRGTGIQIGKTENHIGYQIKKPISIFDENRKPNAKNR